MSDEVIDIDPEDIEIITPDGKKQSTTTVSCEDNTGCGCGCLIVICFVIYIFFKGCQAVFGGGG